MMNLNYLFNVEYYSKLELLNTKNEEIGIKLITSTINDKWIEDCNELIMGQRFHTSCEVIPFTEHSFVMETLYPGLLIGTGNVHESKSTKDIPEIKLGFTLDYVTGLPIIPGSGIKGVIRSVVGADAIQNMDIFLDAIPIKANQSDCLYGLDSITPHDKSGLKNPNPITTLRVLPQVKYLFRFLNKENNPALDTRIFEYAEILEFLGIGAKTHVGYGAMQRVDQKGPYYWLTMKSEA